MSRLSITLLVILNFAVCVLVSWFISFLINEVVYPEQYLVTTKIDDNMIILRSKPSDNFISINDTYYNISDICIKNIEENKLDKAYHLQLTYTIVSNILFLIIMIVGVVEYHKDADEIYKLRDKNSKLCTELISTNYEIEKMLEENTSLKSEMVNLASQLEEKTAKIDSLQNQHS